MSLRDRYDVFLSYAHGDEATVEAAARHLKSAGLAVFFAKWHLVPGEPWQEALEQCLSESGTCAVFIGASGLGKWVNEELRTALDDRVQGQLKRVIPVLLPGAVEAQVPKFLRRVTYVDARDGWNAHTVGRLISGIHGTPVEQQPRSQSLARLALGIVHPLPPAPVFVGREREIAFLRDFMASPSARVASLVGLGGAGKTALVSRFLDEITQSARPAIDDLFVWSFYLDQDASVFLKTLLAHVGPNETRDATGVALLYRLMTPLADGRRRLIVMDGLERMQETRSKDAIAFGQISDPLLRQFVSRLCNCSEETRCIITTRFPVSDLYAWKGQAYVPVPIDSLAPADAKALLARHGVHGDDRAIDRLIATFGAHALTLDHLGVYLREYRSGNASAADDLPEPSLGSDVPEERRLARVLLAYEASLQETELDLLCRLSIFRFGADLPMLHRLFAASGGDARVCGSLPGLSAGEFRSILKRLAQLHLVLSDASGRYTTHPAVRDHFYKRFAHASATHEVVGRAYWNAAGLNALDAWNALVERYGHGTPRTLAGEFQAFLREHRAQVTSTFAEAVTVFAEALGRTSAKLPELPDAELVAGQIDVATSSDETVSLAGLPGTGLPCDSVTLDLIEEVIHHSFQAGRSDDARAIYNTRLGGRDHLAKRLGEFARGVRITQALSENQDAMLDLAWYLRGVGDLDRSYEAFQHTRPMWGGAVLVLQGKLLKVALERVSWPQTREVAAFLAGQAGASFNHDQLGWGEPFCAPWLALVAGDVSTANRLVSTPTYRGYAPDAIHMQLAVAELARANHSPRRAQTEIEKAAPWIMRSASVEHLCMLHLVRGRTLTDLGQLQQAETELREGASLAQRCGLAIHHADLMNALSAVLIARATTQTDDDRRRLDLAAAMSSARAALEGVDGPESHDGSQSSRARVLGAADPECHYVWGASTAYQNLRSVHVALGQQADAQEMEACAREWRDKVGRGPS